MPNTIADLKAGQKDRIDVSAIDALPKSKAKNGAFKFIGDKACGKKPDRLRFAASMLEVGVTDDGTADLRVILKGVRSLTIKEIPL